MVSRTRVRDHQEGREDTGITVEPHSGPIDSTRESLEVVHECKDTLAAESTEHPTSVTGSELDIRRMGLPGCRILSFHVNAEAFHKKFSSGAAKILQFLYAGITAQVDFILGDGNLYAQRNFQRDSGSDFNTCTIVDLLERVLLPLNESRGYEHKITYNVVSSTSALEWVKGQKGLSCDADSMILISLRYGKQVEVAAERSKGPHKDDVDADITAYSEEIHLKSRERAKNLTGYDLGLRISDAAWHSPLLAHATCRAMKNIRTRNEQSAKRRKENRERTRESRRQERQQEDQQKGSGKGKGRNTVSILRSVGQSPTRLLERMVQP